MFSDVLSALGMLRREVERRRVIADEDQKKFADICDAISSVLQRYIDASPEQKQSIALCAELKEYVMPIRKLASGRLPSDEIDRVASALDDVCDTWRKLHGTAEAGLHSDERHIDQLRKAEGMFKGLANVVRAM